VPMENCREGTSTNPSYPATGPRRKAHRKVLWAELLELPTDCGQGNPCLYDKRGKGGKPQGKKWAARLVGPDFEKTGDGYYKESSLKRVGGYKTAIRTCVSAIGKPKET